MGLLSRLFGGDRTPRELVTDLVDNYQAEVAQAACLRSHADQARYPHVATQLRALAVIEDRHAGLLRDHILGLGGGIPPVAPAPAVGIAAPTQLNPTVMRSGYSIRLVSAAVPASVRP